MGEHTLRITEIFHSLQGETTTVGLPTVFVRLTGCPLRCQYCDTAYAFHGGEVMDMDEIVASVDDFGADYVTVTGGEPLAQKNVHYLLTSLCDKEYTVSLETSGALPIDKVDQRVINILDIKTPDSGESEKNDYRNIGWLKPSDQIKFVLCSRRDYDWAKFKIDEYGLSDRVNEILLSPSHGQLNPTQLADWILADKLKVRFQQQLHKHLWNDEPGH